MKFIHYSILVCSLCSFLFLSGCSGKPQNPDGRLDVSGKITLNGGPFEGAELCNISMTSIDTPSQGSSSTTFSASTGQYLFTLGDGLKPGKYKVSITASAIYDKKTKKPVTKDTPEGGDYRISLVPLEFNKNSTLEFEVVEGKKNVFDYDVVAELNFDQ